jgi:hypothetical protein
MRSVWRPKTATAIILLITAIVIPGNARSQGLRGDSEAIAMARTMIQQMGGSRLWAEAMTLRIVEEVHHPNERLPYRSESWRSLNEPSIWGRSQSAEVDHTFARTHEQGWNLGEGRLTKLSEMDVRQWVGRWPRNIYVMFHRLAREDPRLWLVKEQERRFAVLDEGTGDKLCAFEVTVGGAILRWSTAFGTGAEEWIYGPLTDFGPIRMPAWGVRLQDTYRFYYREVALSKTAPPVSFEAPRPR